MPYEKDSPEYARVCREYDALYGASRTLFYLSRRQRAMAGVRSLQIIVGLLDDQIKRLDTRNRFDPALDHILAEVICPQAIFEEPNEAVISHLKSLRDELLEITDLQKPAANTDRYRELSSHFDEAHKVMKSRVGLA